MKPKLAEELAEKVLQEMDKPQSRERKRLYLLGLFITLIHPLQAHDDQGLRQDDEPEP
jgi:hypothetical protein